MNEKHTNPFINLERSLLLERDIYDALARVGVTEKAKSLGQCLFQVLIIDGIELDKINVNLLLATKNEDGTPRISEISKRKTKCIFLKNNIFEPEAPHFFTPDFLMKLQAELIKIIQQKKEHQKTLAEHRKALEAMRFQKTERAQMLKEHINNFIAEDEIKKDVLQQFYKNNNDMSGRCEIKIDFEKLEVFNQDIADALWESPDEVINDFTEVLGSIGAEVLSQRTKVKNSRICKEPVLVPVELIPRFINIPSYLKTSLKNLSSDDLFRLVKLKVTVMRITAKHHKIINAKFVCNRCGNEVIVPQPLTKSALTYPQQCQDCDRRDFRGVPEESVVIDCRFASVQDTLDEMSGGEPDGAEVWLTDSLADNIAPGNTITLTAIPKIKEIRKTTSAILERYLEAVSVEVHDTTLPELSDEEYAEIKELGKDDKLLDKEISSIAPNVNGNRRFKELLNYWAFGGASNLTDAAGNRIRGKIHIMAIGDPGVAKTIAAMELRKILPSVTYIVGTDTTAAGLTAAAKEDKTLGGYVLEAGAIVKSPWTIIDEFNNFDNEELLELNTPLASGELYINKAGITARYKINTGVLAIANPKKEKFDRYKDIPPQIACPRTLISRFDVIPILFKETDIEKRKATRDLILNPACKDYKNNTPEREIDPETFKKLILYARTINPILTKEATEEIRAYTNYLIEVEGDNAVSFVERQVYPLVRLTTARARARLKKEATKEDAKAAIELFDYFLKKIATDRKGNIDFNKVIGYSRDTREKFETIKEVVKEISDAADTKTASVEEVRKRVNIKEFDELIEELKKKGEIWECREGMLKIREY